MTSGIFISYRRDDAPAYAGRLYDRLASHFGKARVFMDVEGIEPGTDFVDAIERAVGACDVLIVVIGSRWLAPGADAKRRLDDPSDFVRIETVTALRRNIRVVPVLVEDTPMPSADQMPADLAPLARRQAVEINHRQWDATSGELIDTLERILGGEQAAIAEPRREAVASAERAIPARRARPYWIAGVAVVIVLAVLAGYFTPWRASIDASRSAQAPAPGVAAQLPGTVAADTNALPTMREGASTSAQSPTNPATNESAPAPKVAAADSPANASEKSPPAATSAIEAPAHRPSKSTASAPAPSIETPAKQAPKSPPAATTAAESATKHPLKPSTAATTTPVESPGKPAPKSSAAPIPSPAEAASTQTPTSAAPAAPATTPHPPPSESQRVATLAPRMPALPAKFPHVGDRWQYRATSVWKNVEPRSYTYQVRQVSEREVTETIAIANAAKAPVTQAIGAAPRFVEWRGDGYYLVEFNPFLQSFDDLRPGVEWKRLATPNADPFYSNWYGHGRVVGWERVTVPAGTFNALRVDLDSSRKATASLAMQGAEPVRIVHVAWYVPDAKRTVKQVRTVFSASGRKLDEDTLELTSYTVQ